MPPHTHAMPLRVHSSPCTLTSLVMQPPSWTLLLPLPTWAFIPRIPLPVACPYLSTMPPFCLQNVACDWALVASELPLLCGLHWRLKNFQIWRRTWEIRSHHKSSHSVLPTSALETPRIRQKMQTPTISLELYQKLWSSEPPILPLNIHSVSYAHCIWYSSTTPAFSFDK